MTFSLNFVSSFNGSLFERLVNSSDDFEACGRATSQPYIDFCLEMVGDNRHRQKHQFIWLRPQDCFEAISNMSKGLGIDNALLERELSDFANYVRLASEQNLSVTIASFHMAAGEKAELLQDFDQEFGLSLALQTINTSLTKLYSSLSNVTMIDTSRWFETSAPFDEDYYFFAKVPFKTEVFRAAARDIDRVLKARQGKRRKLLILDLDNTLWGGEIGDAGIEGIRLGGHDAQGEAFQAFQHEITRLKSRGILLAIVSKNTEEIALDAIRNHPEMVLKEDDFVAMRINWHPKDQNIISLLDELNLSADAAVFLDDSPYERNWVSDNMPEVYVPELPTSPLKYPSFLRRLFSFDTFEVTSEDLNRTRLYQQETQRKHLNKTLNVDRSSFIRALDITISVEPLSNENVTRAVQLLNKTNQMNLRTRRLEQSGFMDWANDKDVCVLVFSLRDKFGNMGIIGVASGCKRSQDTATIEDFVVSCRAFSRGVEEAMLSSISKAMQSLGVKSLNMEYLPTKRNMPCKEFLENCEVVRSSDGFCFAVDLGRAGAYVSNDVSVENAAA